MARNDMDKPYGIGYAEDVHRRVERALALLMYEEYAKNKVKGRESVLVSPELAKLISDNRSFFEALTEPGLVEWLEPLVKSKPLTRETP